MKAQKVKQVIKVGKISKKDLEKLTQCGYAVIVGASPNVIKRQLKLIKAH